MKTQNEVRAAFWAMLKDAAPALYRQGKPSQRQNRQPADIRCMFVDYVDQLHRSGEISDKLANRVTL